MPNQFDESAGDFVMAGRNGVPRRSYSLGSMPKADLVMNQDSCFDRDGHEVSDAWNHIQATCQGDWFSFMRFQDDWVEVIVVFARDDDALAFETYWGMGA